MDNAIGTFFIELAKKDIRRWFINLPDEDLAYFPEGTDHFNDYVEAVGWAQDDDPYHGGMSSPGRVIGHRYLCFFSANRCQSMP